MIKISKLIFAYSMLLGSTICTTMHEFIEDAYAMQAPQEIVALAAQVAQTMEFYDPYQIVVPKKPGVEVNPWNKFVASGQNPQTQLLLLVVNPLWFSQLDHDGQIFLLGRNFIKGAKPLSMQAFPYIWILCIILISIALFIALGRTRLAQYRFWIRVIIVYAIILVCNLTFLNSLQTKLLSCLGSRHDQMVNRLVSEKTGNREAAIRALEYFDASIKNELHKGELFFAPYATMFEDYAKALKKENN